tara:strand:+ start:148 stop:762 length:615 start_codon:yes stop_codon:yes gene_type:complete
MDIISKYFDLSQKQTDQFIKLEELYRYWNKKINLISRKDIDHLSERHILHSLSISKIIKFNNNTKILDVGTGGGLPGIPLAIMFNNVHFTLNDSIYKKIKVVEKMVKSIGLKNISTINDRVENIDDKFDFIIGRGVTKLSIFHDWVKYKINKENKNSLDNGILYLKGGDHNLNTDIYNVKEYNLNNIYSEEFFLTKKIVYFNQI